MTADGPREPTRDLFLGGKLGLRQPPAGHRAGTDALLLAAAAGLESGSLIDLGAGVGTAGLAVAIGNPAIHATLVEISPDLADIARRNIAENDLADRVQSIACDALSARSRRDAGLADNAADAVIANPPWLAPDRARVSPNPARARAHAAPREAGDLTGVDAWVRAMAALLRAGGRMTMIHRADALGEILGACAGRFGDLVILPVHPQADASAIRIIISGNKGSRAPLRIAPALVLHRADGHFTPLAEAIHRGEATIKFR